MTTVKEVILTAISNKGIENTKQQVNYLADNLFCTKSYVLSIIQKVEKGLIKIVNY